MRSVVSGLGLCRGAEEFCGDGGDEAAGDEALEMGAEVVFAPGDDVALACCECVEADASDFFGGFAGALGGGGGGLG